MRKIRPAASRINSLLVVLLAFFLPLSTTAITVLAVVILLLWLLEGQLGKKISEIFSNPVVCTVIVFLALLVLGVFLSADFKAGIAELLKQWKIAMLPIFLTIVDSKDRSRCIHAFLAGLCLAMLTTYLAWFDLLHYADVTPEHLTRKTFHVIYNPLLAFGIYLVLHEAIWIRRGIGRLLLLTLAWVMIFNMFITEGRTGQLVFFVLMGLLLFQIFTRNRLRALLASCVLIPLMFLAGYTLSPMFQQRVDTARQEIREFHSNPDTSVGMRLLFWKNSWQIIRQHPLLGVGTGGFSTAYATVNREMSPNSVATDNPHNQYVLVAVMLGIPGILALLAIFAVQLRQAAVIDDQWKRVRVAFPVFFLTIMLTESYLKVYETGFFFALFTAVLYRKTPDPRLEPLLAGARKCWLILSYRANVEGSACSQHIDDRLPFFRRHGIEPVLLTGPVGNRSDTWIHYRTFSLAPSGIRFEVRHFLRRHLHRRWQFKLAETILLLPVFPLYLLEKIIINLESEWSWWFLASIRGCLLCRHLRPEVVYSTGGSASAHVAALLIRRWTGTRWLAETQDPLVHDHDWQRSRMVLGIYKNLEKKICSRADAFIFLVRKAMQHTEQRVKGTCHGVTIYPGAVPSLFGQDMYRKGDRCHFAHFGTLAGSRNLAVFLQALHLLLEDDPSLRPLLQVDLYGSFDGTSERTMQHCRLEDIVVHHGAVARKEAVTAMQQTDCLLLIQNVIFFSCETIPSKVYEYLLSGRPIIGLLHHNEELEVMLTRNGHQVVPAENVTAVAEAIRHILELFRSTDFASREPKQVWTVDGAVRRMIALARQ